MNYFASPVDGKNVLRFFSVRVGKLAGYAALMTVVIAFALLALPEKAFAWGPGVHMVTGNWLLQNLAVLPTAVGAALMQYPGQFLNGCLSPDIFIGKGCKPQPKHSHNWDSGFALLQRATTSRGRAFAYGYLSHLAADTVAHNIFVPKGFARVFGSGRAAHIYLEMQADRLIAWDKDDALTVLKETEGRWNTRLLQRSMKQYPLAFWMKKHMFQSGITFSDSNFLHNSLRFMHRFFPFADQETIEYLEVMSTRAIASVLKEGKNSPVVLLDPIGAEEIKKSGQEKRRHTTLLHGVICLRQAHDDSVTAERSRLLPDILENLPEPLADLPSVCIPGEPQ